MEGLNETIFSRVLRSDLPGINSIITVNKANPISKQDYFVS